MNGGKGKVRIMFQDEAGFGRISHIDSCWTPQDVRVIVPGQQIREYNYIYGAVDPRDGERFFITAPACNSDWMNPIEQLWRELRKDFANIIFKSLKDVMKQLEISVNNLTDDIVKCIMAR